MIPSDKSAAVTRGLREAFGVSAIEVISELTISPTSDLIYRIVVRGSPFLLRIIRRVSDPACHFTCVKAAAEASVAPRVWYISTDDGIAITDFVMTSPFPLADARVRIARALRTLHSLCPFPTREQRLNTSCSYLLGNNPAAGEFIRNFHAANIVPSHEREEVFAAFAQIEAAYSCHDADRVSCHNDLKPENILFDGRSVWLVDWEAAFLNDRYVDLAMIASFVADDEADGKTFLQEYFGQKPDEYHWARFFLMRQVFHLFYAMAFLLIGAARTPADLSESAPEFMNFHRRIWAGEVNLRDDRMRIAYGRVHWERLLHNTRQGGFREHLKIVSGG